MVVCTSIPFPGPSCTCALRLLVREELRVLTKVVTDTSTDLSNSFVHSHGFSLLCICCPV